MAQIIEREFRKAAPKAAPLTDSEAARQRCERRLREDPFLAELVARFDAHRRSFEQPATDRTSSPRQSPIISAIFQEVATLVGRALQRPKGQTRKKRLARFILGA